jgi:hypothetical protein
MRDTELYRAILGLESPWTVARVELDVKQQRVDVYAEHGKRKTWPCPECEASCGLHDHDEERTWRHLDSCQFQTYLHASVPRVRCDEHGVRQVRVPWAEPRSRFTLLFERFAIDVLHETDNCRCPRCGHVPAGGNFPVSPHPRQYRPAVRLASNRTSVLSTVRSAADADRRVLLAGERLRRPRPRGSPRASRRSSRAAASTSGRSTPAQPHRSRTSSSGVCVKRTC